MGFTATQVDEMTMWQFQAQAEAFADANTPKDKKKMSVAEFEELEKWMDEAP